MDISDVDGVGGSGDLDETGATATEVVAGAPECGQWAWGEDPEAHEKARSEGDAVSDLVEETDTTGRMSEAVPVLL